MTKDGSTLYLWLKYATLVISVTRKHSSEIRSRSIHRDNKIGGVGGWERKHHCIFADR